MPVLYSQMYVEVGMCVQNCVHVCEQLKVGGNELHPWRTGLNGSWEENWELKGNVLDNVATSSRRASSHKLPHCFQEPNSWPNLWRGWKTHNWTFSSTDPFDPFTTFTVSALSVQTIDLLLLIDNTLAVPHIRSASEDLFWLGSCTLKTELNEWVFVWVRWRRQGTLCDRGSDWFLLRRSNTSLNLCFGVFCVSLKASPWVIGYNLDLSVVGAQQS